MSSSEQQPQRQLSTLSEQELASQLNTLAQSGQDVTPLLNEMMRRVSRARMHSSHTQQQQQQQQQQIASLQQTVQQLTTTLSTLQSSIAAQSAPAPAPAPSAPPRVKFEKPPKYDGSPAKLANWMFLIEQFCTVTNITSSIEQQQYASSRLEGRALTWWRTECHKDVTALATWDLVDLFDGLKSAFLDVDRVAKLRERFDNIRQLTSVTAYTQAFKGLILDFGTMGPDDETVLHAYIRGLKPDVRLDVYKARPTLLADAIMIAERTDQALQLNRGRSRPVFSTRPQVPRPRQQGPVPMDIDALQQKPNQRPSASQNRPSPPQKVPLQAGQPVGIYCWHCGKPGHTKRDCQILQRQLHNQQQRGGGAQQMQHGLEQQQQGECDVPAILGMSFLKKVNPLIDWATRTVSFTKRPTSLLKLHNSFGELMDEQSEHQTSRTNTTSVVDAAQQPCNSPRDAARCEDWQPPIHSTTGSFPRGSRRVGSTQAQQSERKFQKDRMSCDSEFLQVLNECDKVGGFDLCWQQLQKSNINKVQRIYCPKCGHVHFQTSKLSPSNTHLCLNIKCKHVFTSNNKIISNPLAAIIQKSKIEQVPQVQSCQTVCEQKADNVQSVLAVQCKVQSIENCTIKAFQRGLSRGDYVEAYYVHARPEVQQCNFTHQHAHGTHGSGDKTTLQLEQESMLSELKAKYPAMFEEPTYPVERSQHFQHKIDLKDPTADPPKKRLYPLDTVELQALKEQLDLFLKTNRIVPSSSPYGAPILFAKKKDGGLRMCIDYRMLNKNTIVDSYPLPRIDELLAQIGGAKVFSKLDLRDGYHQLPMRAEDREKTAFSTRYGQFEWTVMPFGLCNAPSTFQRVMHTVFFDLLDVCVLIYLDDILIFSKNIDEHKKHLRMVFERLHKNNLFIKETKCALFLQSVEFLGHRIDQNGVSVEEGKTDVIKNWPTPTNVNQIQQFLGLGNYYRKFIRNFAKIATPLTQLTKKAIAWQWQSAQQSAFEKLKQVLVAAPCLKVFDRSCKTRLWTDASDFCVGAVLEQLDSDNQWHPVEYFSKKLNDAQQNYSATERELLAVYLALEKWRQYLIGINFTVYTDHASLQYLHTQARLSRRQARWLEFFSKFSFAIEHVSGKSNVVADALSRVPTADQVPVTRNNYVCDNSGYTNKSVGQDLSVNTHINAVISLNDESMLTDTIRESQAQYCDDEYMRKCTSACTSTSTEFAIRDKVVCKLVRDHYAPVIPPNDQQLKQLLLKEVHNTALGGHLGYFKMVNLLQRRFWWKNLRADVKKFIKECITCQQNKTSTQKTPGELYPHVVPTRPFEHVSMDFIVQLPPSNNNYDSIYVIVDRYSKYVILIPTTSDVDAEGVARLFYDNCVCKFGMPAKIISDRDTKFQSVFWQSLMRLLDCKINMSSSYHPQTDGQSERFNRSIEQIIRCYISPTQDNWDTLLQQVAFSLNNTVHQGTQQTPFSVLFGFEARLPLDHALSTLHDNKNPASSDFVTARNDARTAVKTQLERYNDLMKQTADKHRRQLEFAEGDYVWLNSAHLRLPGKLTRKFAAKWCGPYRVSQRVSHVAYRLELPQELRGIHNVFHVSVLKAHAGEVPAACAPVFIGGEPEFEVEALVDKRLGRQNRPEYLVHWKGYAVVDQTWEPLANLENCGELIKQFEAQHGRQRRV